MLGIDVEEEVGEGEGYVCLQGNGVVWSGGQGVGGGVGDWG